MDAKCVKVIEVQKGFKSLIATENIRKGQFLGDFRGKVIPERTRYTVQIGADYHIDSDGNVIFANHSCSPNAQMVFQPREDMNGNNNNDKNYAVSWHMVAARDIPQGEPITFDYTTTEYFMVEPFDCLCKSNECLGRVQGFKHLPQEEKAKRLPRVSPVIKNLHENEGI